MRVERVHGTGRELHWFYSPRLKEDEAKAVVEAFMTEYCNTFGGKWQWAQPAASSKYDAIIPHLV